MEWKQPEAFRRHWILDALDGELLFSHVPAGAAQGRMGDDVYDLRDGGLLRAKRTLAVGKSVVATLEQSSSGASGVLRHGQTEYRWKSLNAFGTRWVLLDPDGEIVFRYAAKAGLAKSARVELKDDADESTLPLLLLCWYSMVL